MRSLLVPALVFAAAVGCGKDGANENGEASEPKTGEEPRTYPEGTVVAVGGSPIARDVVEGLAAWVQRLYPEYSALHCKRLALTSVCLEREAVRVHFAEARAEAEDAARKTLESIAPDGAPPGLSSFAQVEGSWTELELDLWAFAREREPGIWHGPFERTGRFLLVRVDDVQAADSPNQERMTLTLVDFPFLPPDTSLSDLREVLGEYRLEVVDPAYEEIVPESWKFMMRGNKG